MVLSIHPLDELSKDPVAFHEALTWIFMDSGAAIIEREIARKLLDRMGENPIGKNSHLWSFTIPESHSKSSQRVSEAEKKVLRQFLALASLQKVYPAESEIDANGDTIGASSIELTALRFASAFKKGR